VASGECSRVEVARPFLAVVVVVVVIVIVIDATNTESGSSGHPRWVDDV
jgi:hypothetical protein